MEEESFAERLQRQAQTWPTFSDGETTIINGQELEWSPCPHNLSRTFCPDPVCVQENAEWRAKHERDERDSEYEKVKLRREAEERYKRERLDAAFAGELTPAQEAQRDRIRGRIMSRDELARLPRPESLIDGLLFFDSLAWVAGESGSYKSFVTLDIAARFASDGMDYHGLMMQHGKALIVVGEGNSAYIDRVRAWEIYNRRPWPDDCHFHDGAIQLGDDDSVAAIRDVIKSDEYGLVVLDTQAMMTVGVEENSATEMGHVMAVLHALREVYHGCILTVHHFGKSSENMRGSGAIYAAATTVVVTEREGTQVKLSTMHDAHGKQKDAKEREYGPFVMSDVKVDEEEERWSLVLTAPGGADVNRRMIDVDLTKSKWDVPILRALVEYDATGVTHTALAKYLAEQGLVGSGGNPIDSGTVSRRVNALIKVGVVDGSQSSAKITAKGRRALAAHDHRARVEDDE
jgi:hypothetical protein